MSVVVALMGLVFVAVGGYFVYRGGRELRTVYHQYLTRRLQLSRSDVRFLLSIRLIGLVLLKEQ